MKPSDELFRLVKSMSKSEKRFFKLSSSLQSGDKNYIKLFDAIERQKEYDEEEIKDAFRGEIFIRHLPSEKNHLYKLILKSLRGFHADISVSSILQEEIKNVEILYGKALYKECTKIIRKAKKLAYSHEKFYYAFELIQWEKVLLEEEFLYGNFDHDLDALIKEEQVVISKLRNLAEYRMLYSKINYVFRKGGIARDARELELVEEISNHPLIVGKNTALSSRAAATCYYIQGLGALFKKDYATSFGKFSRVVKIFEDNPLLIHDIPKQYVRSLTNLLFCHIDNHDFNAFFDLIEKMRGLEQVHGFNSLDIQMRIFTSTYNAELVAYDAMADYEKALSLIPLITQAMQEYEGKMSKEDEILFYYNIAYSYFGGGKPKEALRWINKILNDNESELRQDMYSYARLFNLIIHFELKNFDLLDYTVKSTMRFYSKKEKELGLRFQFEDAFLQYLRRVVKVHDQPAQVRLVFEELRQELELISGKDYESTVLDYFDFMAWVESHIHGKSFAEVRKERAQAKVS